MRFPNVGRSKRWWLLGALVLLPAASVGIYFGYRSHRLQSLLDQSSQAFSSGQYAQAEELAGRVLAGEPESVAALVLAGRAAGKLGRDHEAAAYFDRIAEDDPAVSPDGLHEAGEVALRRGRAAEAERYLRRALRQDPQHLPSNLLLAYLLSDTPD